MDTHSHSQESYENSRWKAFGIVLIILSLLTVAGVFAFQQLAKQNEPTTYEECIAQNDSQTTTIYPGVCTTKSGKQFTQPLSPEEQESLKPPVEEQTTIPGWETYQNEEYGFETKYNPESNPSEIKGNEAVGQFSYLLTIKFGTNPLKSLNGYDLRINKQQSLENYRLELIGHMTDSIDSEEEVIVNNNTWTKLNYTIFLTTDYVPVTTAITHHNNYSYAITSSSQDSYQILSTFRFLDEQSIQPPLVPSLPEISWQEAVSHIQNCNVDMVTQTHSLYVNLDLKDGRTVTAKEPAIDDVFVIVQEVQDTCGAIGIATE